MARKEPVANREGEAGEQETGSKLPPVLKQRGPSQTAFDLDQNDQHADAAPVPEPDPGSVHVYDLFKNAYCIATLVFLGALIAYYILDSLPLGETYVAGFPYALFALVGAGCALPVFAANHLGGVPRAVSTGLAITAGLVGVLAAHPALLRINALTDTGEMQVVEYVRMTRNHFDPVDDEWPAINMIGGQYWASMPGDVSRRIPIRHGGLGFYQADLTAIRFELEFDSAFVSVD